MRSVLLGLMFLAAAAFAPGPTRADDATCLQPPATLRAEVEAPCFAFVHDGTTRTYRLFAAPTDPADGGPRPLLVVLHGALDSGAGIEAITEHAFNRLAEREGLIVAYPDGVERGWNAGLVPMARDDVGALVALIDAVDDHVAVDRHAVMAAGFSNGGVMALRLACEASAHFAAVSAVAAGLPRNLAEGCRPERPVGVQVVIGDRDAIVPLAGGPVTFLGQRFGDLLPAAEGADLFVARASALGPQPCSPAQTRVEDAVPDDGTRLLVRRTPCAGTAIELVVVEGGGHTWPGGLQYLDETVIGVTSRETDAGGMVWPFLSRFRTE